VGFSHRNDHGDVSQRSGKEMRVIPQGFLCSLTERSSGVPRVAHLTRYASSSPPVGSAFQVAAWDQRVGRTKRGASEQGLVPSWGTLTHRQDRPGGGWAVTLPEELVSQSHWGYIIISYPIVRHSHGTRAEERETPGSRWRTSGHEAKMCRFVAL